MYWFDHDLVRTESKIHTKRLLSYGTPPEHRLVLFLSVDTQSVYQSHQKEILWEELRQELLIQKEQDQSKWRDSMLGQLYGRYGLICDFLNQQEGYEVAQMSNNLVHQILRKRPDSYFRFFLYNAIDFHDRVFDSERSVDEIAYFGIEFDIKGFSKEYYSESEADIRRAKIRLEEIRAKKPRVAKTFERMLNQMIEVRNQTLKTIRNTYWSTLSTHPNSILFTDHAFRIAFQHVNGDVMEGYASRVIEKNTNTMIRCEFDNGSYHDILVGTEPYQIWHA